MRKKVSTIMDASLFHRAKLEAVRQARPLSAILEEALDAYLSGRSGKPSGSASRVDATWGAMPASPDLVRAVMEEEDDWLDA
jgi:hypothetical protein